jgi:uncharacterized membrane protein
VTLRARWVTLRAHAGIYLGIVNNSKFPRFVRFNAVQAIMLDVLMIFPSMVEYAFGVPRYGMALTLYGAAHSVIWVVVNAVAVYALVSNCMGRLPWLPFVSEAAEQQIP